MPGLLAHTAGEENRLFLACFGHNYTFARAESTNSAALDALRQHSSARRKDPEPAPPLPERRGGCYWLRTGTRDSVF